MTVLAFFFSDLSAPAAVLFGVGALATISVPVQLADVHRSDFPRLWQAAVDAQHDVDWTVASALHLADAVVLDVRLTLRSAALAAAAFLALLLPAPEGATR